jgi:hypothetical protein
MGQFSYTTKSGRLTIRESPHGFYVTDNQTNKQVACGTGEQWVSGDDVELSQAEAEQMRNDRIIDEMETAEQAWVKACLLSDLRSEEA